MTHRFNISQFLCSGVQGMIDLGDMEDLGKFADTDLDMYRGVLSQTEMRNLIPGNTLVTVNGKRGVLVELIPLEQSGLYDGIVFVKSREVIDG